MGKPKIHVVYEYGTDFRPHSSPFIRLLRPLTHPAIRDQFEITFDTDHKGQPTDLVIVERLWRPDVSLDNVKELVNNIRLADARFIYSIDDNFFDLVAENKGWPPPEFLPVTEYLLRRADGVMVSTPALKNRLLEFNEHILVVGNALDERLLTPRFPGSERLSFPKQRTIIGYMGTLTHDEDLLMILPALESVCRRYPDQIEFQLAGAVRSEETKKMLLELPIRFISPRPDEIEYPLFMLWWSGQVHWDIGIAPLRETLFTRCKSDVKFLDYAAIGTAGIFSRLPAYTATIRHQETGWLAENHPDAWEEALEKLISDRALRVGIAQNAYRYLYAERLLAHRAVDWSNALHTFLAD